MCSRRVLPESIWKQYRTAGSSVVRNRIAMQHIDLVRSIAHRMETQCAESYEDLEQIGFIGLLKAVERFQVEKGVAFSSFAIPYIQGEMLHFLRDHWGHLKVPRRATEMSSKVKNRRRRAIALGREVTEAEVASRLRIKPEKWRWVSEATSRKPLVCIDEMPHPPGEEQEEPQDEYQEIRARVARLPNPYRACLVEFYFQQLSEEAIAQQQHTSVAQVHLWIEEGVRRLRSHCLEVENVG